MASGLWLVIAVQALDANLKLHHPENNDLKKVWNCGFFLKDLTTDVTWLKNASFKNDRNVDLRVGKFHNFEFSRSVLADSAALGRSGRSSNFVHIPVTNIKMLSVLFYVPVLKQPLVPFQFRISFHCIEKISSNLKAIS